MTRQEVNKRLTEFNRYRWTICIPIIVVIVAITARILIGRFMRLSSAAESIANVAIFIVLCITFPVLTLILSRAHKRIGLICPSCQKPIVGRAGRYTLTSGKCNKCGNQILDDL